VGVCVCVCVCWRGLRRWEINELQMRRNSSCSTAGFRIACLLAWPWQPGEWLPRVSVQCPSYATHEPCTGLPYCTLAIRGHSVLPTQHSCSDQKLFIWLHASNLYTHTNSFNVLKCKRCRINISSTKLLNFNDILSAWQLICTLDIRCMQMMNALNKAWCLHVPHLKTRLCGVIRCDRGGEEQYERESLYVYACVWAFPLWAYAETVSMQSHYWETHQEDENKLYCSTKWQTATIKKICWEGNLRVLFVPPLP